MKPFTEQEMICVAKAAEVFGDYQYQVLSKNLSVLTSIHGITISHSSKTGRFTLASDSKSFVHSYDVHAVSDTIREILKERGDDNTSN